MTALVLGASGFLGSHITRQLAESGETVRVLARPSSSLAAVEGLDIEVVRGDLGDPKALAGAMAGVDDVYYCIVDARAWIRDQQALVATNVGLLRTVIDVAVASGLRRFLYTSTLITMSDNAPPCAYVDSRIAGERLVLDAARERGLPAIVLCVANTYGRGDLLPTPHGRMVYDVALGRMPFYIRAAGTDVVGVEDAAAAFLLAADKGELGERYLVAERQMTMREVFEAGADAAGVEPPKRGLSPSTLMVAGALGGAWSALSRRDVRLTRTSVRLMQARTSLDGSATRQALGWTPRPTPDAIREGVLDYLERRAARRSATTATRS